MIPKFVHYCWFGGRPKPANVLEYIQNWQSMLPDYEIHEWNESNFDLDAWPYARQAWDAGKYAFVSDVARLHALHQLGGVYLDTDVEVRRPFDDLLDNPVVLGFEEGDYIATSTILAMPKSRLIGDFLASYQDRRFIHEDGNLDQTTNVEVLTSMLVGSGLSRDGKPQLVSWHGEQVMVVEQVKFSPLDYINGICKADATTYTVHHFGQSWNSSAGRIRASIRRALICLIGGNNLKKIRSVARTTTTFLTMKRQ